MTDQPKNGVDQLARALSVLGIIVASISCWVSYRQVTVAQAALDASIEHLSINVEQDTAKRTSYGSLRDNKKFVPTKDEEWIVTLSNVSVGATVTVNKAWVSVMFIFNSDPNDTRFLDSSNFSKASLTQINSDLQIELPVTLAPSQSVSYKMKIAARYSGNDFEIVHATTTRGNTYSSGEIKQADSSRY